MDVVFVLLGVVPSFAAGLHLWRRTDIGYAAFTWWALVILVPWAGPATYAACTSFPLIAAPLLITVGSWLVYAYVAGPVGELVRTRAWRPVAAIDFEANWTHEFDTAIQVRPTYAYVYAGERFAGARLNLSEPPWYASDIPRDGPTPPLRFEMVYVNPKDPAESVVFLAPRRSEHTRAATGFALLTSGIVSIVGRLRRRDARHRSVA